MASQDFSYTTEATATANEATQVRSNDGRLDLALSIPAELGGPGGESTNAEQLLAAGYAACLLSALQYAAARSGTDLPRDTQVTAKLALTHPDQERFAVSIRLLATLPGLEHEQASRLIEQAKTAWPYSEPVIALGSRSGSDVEADDPRDAAGVPNDPSSRRGYGG